MNRLFAFYLLLSAGALAGPFRPAAWPLLALAHLAGAAWLLHRGGREPRESGAVAWLVALYPLLVMPLLYAELPLLNQSVYAGRYFDDVVIGWEHALFGFEPARDLARRWASAWISEPLHAAYLAYYVIIYAPPLLIGRRHGPVAMGAAVFTLMLTFFVHYLFFVYFPVEGPRYRFEAPVPPDAQGPVHAAAHALLEAGSSRGAAFPSSHVAVSVTATFVTWRWLRPLTPAIALLTAGLALGAVYGGFHYAIDAVAGAILGAVLAAAAPRLHRRLSAGRT